jgi:hypothetical protein
VAQPLPAQPYRPTDTPPGLVRGRIAPAVGGMAGRDQMVLPAAGTIGGTLRGLLGGP